MERGVRGFVPAISLFMMTPVSGTIILEPKKRLIVVVKEVAMPEESAVTMWEVPWLCGSADESYHTLKHMRLTLRGSRIHLDHSLIHLVYAYRRS